MKILRLTLFFLTLAFFGNAQSLVRAEVSSIAAVEKPKPKSKLPRRFLTAEGVPFMPCKGHLPPKLARKLAKEKRVAAKQKPERKNKAAVTSGVGSALHFADLLDLSGNFQP